MRRGRGSYRDDVVDPPVNDIGHGGIVVNRAPVESAIGGDGFTNAEIATVWDAFSGHPECINPSSEFLERLDEEPRLRSAAMLRSLGCIREVLDKNQRVREMRSRGWTWKRCSDRFNVSPTTAKRWAMA